MKRWLDHAAFPSLGVLLLVESRLNWYFLPLRHTMAFDSSCLRILELFVTDLNDKRREEKFKPNMGAQPYIRVRHKATKSITQPQNSHFDG